MRYSRKEEQMIPSIVSGSSLADQMTAASLDAAREVIDPAGLPEQRAEWIVPPPEPSVDDAVADFYEARRIAAEEARAWDEMQPRASARVVPIAPPVAERPARRIPGKPEASR